MIRNALLAITGAFRTPGGIAAVNRLIFHCLVDHGVDIDCFSLMETDTTLHPHLSATEQLNMWVFHSHKVAFASSVIQALIRRHYEFVFCDHVNVASFLAPLRSMGVCKPFVWLHGVEVFPPRPTLEGRIGLLQAWHCLASSEFTRKSVLDRYPSKHITVCEPTLDPLNHPILPWEEIIQPFVRIEMACLSGDLCQLGDRVILCTGRMSSFERYKGQDILIEAFPAVQDFFPDAQLVLVGTGDDVSHIRALALNLGDARQQAIFMPGWVENDLLHNLFRKCALFAMPSTGEGFGIVFLEAMSFAKPCIGGSKDAASGVIRDQSTGLILENPRSPTEVARAIIDLFSDPERMQKMGKQGYDLVQSRYLYKHFRERFWNAIQSPVLQPKIN